MQIPRRWVSILITFTNAHCPSPSVTTPINPLYINDVYKEIKCDKLLGGHHPDEQILREAAVHIA